MVGGQEALSIFNILSCKINFLKKVLCEGYGLQVKRKQVPIRVAEAKVALEC